MDVGMNTFERLRGQTCFHLPSVFGNTEKEASGQSFGISEKKEEGEHELHVSELWKTRSI
jgi:hypothetical protein